LIDWKKLAAESSGSGSGIREEALNRLRRRNAELKDEATALREVLLELKDELQGLRWAAESDKLLAADPALATLHRENVQMEKALRETRDEARKLLVEISKLKKELQKRPKK
jgi:predicted RNase H-like nuclease (RuvC/YqgF family)